jgi:hypothetical protein
VHTERFSLGGTRTLRGFSYRGSDRVKRGAVRQLVRRSWTTAIAGTRQSGRNSGAPSAPYVRRCTPVVAPVTTPPERHV